MYITVTIELTNDETGNPLTPKWREQAVEKLQSEIEAISLSIDKDNGDEIPVTVGVSEIK